MTSPDLTTIVVNWNTVGLLDGCLDSIRGATPGSVVNEVIVVDNGSTDGSVDHLRTHWPEVKVIANTENVGFCRANNQAVRASTAPVLLLVNTDARLQPDNVTSLLDYFLRDPQTAVVGPRLVYADGEFQRWTAGRLPSLAAAAAFFLGVDRLGPWQRRGLFLGRDVEQAFQPEWVSSAVMAVRREALVEVGLLDERIFVYMDDVDLCSRIGAAGWRVWYAAETTATHFMGATSKRVTGQGSPEALRAFNRWYVRRHGPASGLALRGVELLGFGARVVAHGAQDRLRSGPSSSGADAHLRHLRLALEPIHV